MVGVDTQNNFRHSSGMKRNFLPLYSLCLCVVLLSGCLSTTTTKTRVKTGDPGRRAVEVGVNEDNTLSLYGNPIDKKALVKRLIKEESADKGRAIVLEAKGDVRRSQLVELREFLVANKIPNVVIVTQRNAVSYENNDPYMKPDTASKPVPSPQKPVTPPQKPVTPPHSSPR